MRQGKRESQDLENPKAKGIDHVFSLLPGIVKRYAHFDLLLWLVDADGRDRSGQFASFEAAASVQFKASGSFVEAWLLAGHTSKLGHPWSRALEPGLGAKCGQMSR